LAPVAAIAVAAFAPAPKTPSASQLAHVRAYVSAVNSGDGKAFRAEDAGDGFRADVPEGPFLHYFHNQHRMTSGLELVDARQESDGAVEAVVRNRLFGTLHGLRFAFDAVGKIATFDPTPAPAWAQTAPGGLSDEAVAMQARTMADRGCKADVFSGAMLVAHGDKVVVAQACGEASKRYHVPNTLETRINLGSANKMFTEIATMQLVEAGKIKLSDPVSAYLDDTWLAPDIARRITVGELLGHTSGLGDFFDDLWPQSRARYRDLADYKPLVRSSKLAFEPGSKFAYSDTGALLLGAVVEKASGKRYDDYLRTHIYAPAGMTRSGCFAMDDPEPDLATGYRYDPSAPYGWRENTFDHVLRGGPAGGCFSTVGDLLRFSRALQSGALVSRATFAWMTTPGLSPEYGQGGFELSQSAAGPIIGHSGIFQGVSVRFHLYPATGWTMIALANVDGGGYALGDALDDVIGRSKRGAATASDASGRP
jgi:CubicO group peptidase (beta-lactamase class C family)